MLGLDGASVSIDAAGCHKEVAEQSLDQGADYVLALTNHAQLFDELNWPFSCQLEQAVPMSKADTLDGAHGPQEERCWLMRDFSYLDQAECGLADWKQFASVIVIDTQVIREGKPTVGAFSLPHMTSPPHKRLSGLDNPGRSENQHYPLDVLCREVAARTRKGFAAQHLASLRRLALTLLNLDTSFAAPKRRKRFKALLDDDCLLMLLGLDAMA